MKRIAAWAVFALVLFGVVKAAQAFKNPWAVPAVPSIASVLPLPHQGCTQSKDCFHD